MGKYVIKQRLTALGLSTSMLATMVGCSLRGHSKDSEEKNVEEGIVEEFVLPTEELSKLVLDISTITPRYGEKIEKQTQLDYDNILEIKDSYHECQNANADYSNLETIIIANSINNVSMEFQMFVNYDLDLSNYKETDLLRDKLMRQSLNAAINNIGPNLTPEDICRLEKISIANIGDGMERCFEKFGKLVEDDIFVFDYKEFIKTVYDINNHSTIENNVIALGSNEEEVIYNEVQEKYYLEALTVYFENVLNMLRTISCKDRIEDGQKNYTINVANNLDFAINAASSREDNSDLSFINQFSFDYIKMNDKRAESLLLLLAVFKENRNLEDYYNTIYNSDLPSFLEFFGVKSKEELETFYKIASSLNEATKIKNGDLSELLKSRNEIGYDYKVDILKISIKDLMNYLLNNQDLTLKEMLYLYNFIKSYVTYGTYTDVEKLIEPETTIKYEYDTEYLKDIYDIETIFYKFIRQYYNVSLEDIEAINKDGYYFSQIDYNSSFASELDIYKLTQKFSLLSVIRKSYTTYYDDVKEFDNNNKKVK